MAIIDIKIPSPGESITHVELFHWLVKDGDVVSKNTEIAELESDKATLMLIADESGKISFKANNLRVEKIEILNVLGEVVYFANKLPEEFDFENKKGIFFVNIYTEKGIQTKKIVVK